MLARMPSRIAVNAFDAVRLTRRGSEVAGRLRQDREAALTSALAALTAGEQARLTHVSERLLAALTSSREQARVICRLCDHGVCQGGQPSTDELRGQELTASR